MDIDQMRRRYAELLALMRALTTAPAGANPHTWDMTAADVDRFDAAEAEANELREQLRDIETRGQRIMSRAGNGLQGDDSGGYGFNVNRGGDAFDLDTVRADASLADLRGRLATGLEADRSVPAEVAEAAVRTLARVQGDQRSLAMRMLATGSQDYRSAFAKLMRGEQATWSEAERQAVARAQSLTTTAGGFAVPTTLDPTVVLTNSSAINPIRNIARVVSTTTNQWDGVTSAGTTFSWDAEGAEVSDDSITLAQPSIPVFKAQAFIPFSVEVGQDWADLQSDLLMVFQDGRDRLEAAAHITGNGTTAPTGIQTELDGTSSEIAPTTGESFTAPDVYKLQRSLGARYRPNAQWVGNIGTFGAIRQFDTSGGGSFWTSLGNGTPERLLGWPAHEHSEVDDSPDINAAATADNFVLYVGDWSRYVIVDRVGMTVELVPHLFHTSNNRPSGQRGLIAWFRTGAELIDDSAVVALSIPTTA